MKDEQNVSNNAEEIKVDEIKKEGTSSVFEKAKNAMHTFKESPAAPTILALLAAVGVGIALGALSKRSNTDLEGLVAADLTEEERKDLLELTDKYRNESWACRNKKLSGALSVGIAPALKEDAAVQQAIYDIRRKYPKLVERVAAISDKRHQQRVDLIEVEKSENNTRAMTRVGLALAAGVANR